MAVIQYESDINVRGKISVQGGLPSGFLKADGSIDSSIYRLISDDVDWTEIANKPSTFPPSAHIHPISDIAGLQASLDSKAPLAGPALTGTPTAPTAVAGTNTTQIATTAFVTAAVAGISTHAPVTLAPPTNGLSLVGQLLGLSTATNLTAGAISAADWNTFNNKANANGSNATGTWGINISGTAAAANNSTLWNSQTYSGALLSSAPTYVMAYDGSVWRPSNAGSIQAFVGVNNGSTLTNNITGTSGSTTKLAALDTYAFNTGSTNGRDFYTGLQIGFVEGTNGYPSFGTVLRGKGYAPAEDGSTFEMYYPYNESYGGNSIKYRLGLYNNGGMTPWRNILDSNNYSSYSSFTGNISTSATSTASAILGSTQSWGGATTYPTLFSNNPDKWVMHTNPHVVYTKPGTNGFSGTMTGATLRFEGTPASASHWDVGVGTNGQGEDKFSIGRVGANFINIVNNGTVQIPNTLDVLGGFYAYGGLSVGTAASRTGNLANANSIAIGDSDTGFRQNGDGVLETFANNVKVRTDTSTLTVNHYDFRNEGTLYARKNQVDGNYGSAALWTESYGGTSTGIAFHISGVVGNFLEMKTNGNLYWANNEIINSSNIGSQNVASVGGLTPDKFEGNYITTIDASGLNQSTYYPVTINLSSRTTTKISVLVGLDSGTVPSWSTHQSGFSVRYISEVNGSGWGTSAIHRKILADAYTFATVPPIGGVSQMPTASKEVIWVRGGGRYFFYTNVNTSVVLRTGSYTENTDTVSPSTTAINNPIEQGSLPVGFGAVYVQGNTVIHSGNISSQSVNYANTAGNSNTVGGYLPSFSGAGNTIPIRNGAGYLEPNNWIQLNGHYGLYAPTNNAHIKPNDGTYGAWKIIGNRNGWGGIEFDTSNGGGSFMVGVNGGVTGFHMHNYGWQWRWDEGTMYVHKNSVGGGTGAAVLDSQNYANYALPLSGGTLSGSVTASAFYQTSDMRLKNILSREGDVIKFKWADGRDNRIHTGYGAQEMQFYYPEQVSQDEKGEYSVNYVEILVDKVNRLERKLKELGHGLE
jgi:hypothetical protein